MLRGLGISGNLRGVGIGEWDLGLGVEGLGLKCGSGVGVMAGFEV